jgi:hypothetical protein
MQPCLYTSIIVLMLASLSFCEEPEKVSACKLKSDPATYNLKLVEMEGFVSHGFEDFTFFDPNCPYSPAIWLEYGGTVASGTKYCCGSTNARHRSKELVVEGVPVPLVDDERFRQLDKLIHDEADTVVHTTFIARFFSGKREQSGGKSSNRGGYGNFGCCSLLAIQQVISVDPHDRVDLDYRAAADQPDFDNLNCGTFRDLFVPSDRAIFDIQHRAEAGDDAGVFSNPKKVAVDFLAQDLKIEQTAITGITEKRSQGRVIYEWQPTGKRETYMVVVSHPYWLSFYAQDETKVAWIVLAAYKACVN